MATTLRDIAESVNVSHTTVSRVLNGRGGSFISDATRKRVLDAVQEMNYRPNRTARALATGRSHQVALWIGDIANPYFASAMHHVETQLKKHDLDMLYVTSRREPHRNSSHGMVDGIFAFNGPENIEAYLDQELESCTPIVNLGCYFSQRVDHVGVDLYAGAYEAVTHLIAQGCERIGYVVSHWGNHAGDARYDAYCAAMEGANRPLEIIPVAEATRGDARRDVPNYIAAHGLPDGLFCFSDDVAIGTYRGLRDMRISIPDDVLLIGCDGIEDTEYLDVPITTIVQPHEQMCVLAWNFLKRRMDNPNLPLQQTVLKPEFVIRPSSQRCKGGTII